MKKKKKKSSGRNGGSSGIDSMFANGKPAEKFYNLPSDTYEGYVKAGSAIIELKPNKIDYKAVLTLVVEEGEYADKEQVARYDLSTQVGVNIFLAELATMDVGEPKSLKEAAGMLEQLDDLKVRFWVSEPEDEYPPKVRINDLLEGGSSAAKTEEPAEDEYTKADIKKLGKDADKDDQDSIDELSGLAKESKIDPDDYTTWAEVADEVIDDLGL